MIIKELNDRHTLFIIEDLFYAGTETIDLNIHLIMAQHYNYLIDTGLGSDSARFIKAYIRSKNDRDLIIINSHYHWDHIWGNAYFDEKWIIGHTNIIKNIEQTYEHDIVNYSNFIKGEVSLKFPNLLVSDELHLKDDNLYIFYTPGHSNDGLSVFDIETGILNVGDNIGDTIIDPIPDLDRFTHDEYRDVIQRYQLMNASLIISGHNKPQTTEFLELILKTLNQ